MVALRVVEVVLVVVAVAVDAVLILNLFIYSQLRRTIACRILHWFNERAHALETSSGGWLVHLMRSRRIGFTHPHDTPQ